ncbi:hypothetical protein J0A68_11395 [Algoriphagus sp. H41]|uniref:DUF4304 domain-containing protein n=1 Tax=Algoriphagus oliviformis TaxID=2811231 RepID=A0ABS3C359_9BACT|nr:hypothetical protein [Algoriphagus oliviformis]MBN7811558.1 hypothetical protein [Algoriphagus oliviformis]
MTDFELTIKNVRPVFDAFGFNAVEIHKNVIRLESSKVTVTIAYDEREKSNLFFVGHINSISHLLNSKNLKEVFNYDRSARNFADFLLDFLNNEGKGILKDDLDKLNELDAFEERQAKIYTNNLLTEQEVSAADNAWANRDYLTFVNVIERIDLAQLPGSYKLKYKMACDRIR